MQLRVDYTNSILEKMDNDETVVLNTLDYKKITGDYLGTILRHILLPKQDCFWKDLNKVKEIVGWCSKTNRMHHICKIFGISKNEKFDNDLIDSSVKIINKKENVEKMFGNPGLKQVFLCSRN